MVAFVALGGPFGLGWLAPYIIGQTGHLVFILAKDCKVSVFFFFLHSTNGAKAKRTAQTP
jgi:hypothetical protein